MTVFEGQNMQTQYSMLSYRINLYFHNYNLSIETDENDHCDRNTVYKTETQKSLKKQLGFTFVTIDADRREDFDVFKAINEIFRYIKQFISASQV